MLKKLIKTLLLTTAFSLLLFSCATTSAKPEEEPKGQVIEINYPTRDYTVAEDSLTAQDKYNKHAYVYLPAGYNAQDTDTKYPVVILMHGDGGDETTWTLNRSYSEIKNSLDEGMVCGEVKEFILVTPCGVSDKSCNSHLGYSKKAGVREFGKELRNDLLPYLRENFNILEGRENVAMAGLSMGAEQTMDIGIGQCLDLISYFGAFSCTPFTVNFDYNSKYLEPAAYINQVENTFPDETQSIKLLYMICGTTDSNFYPGFCVYVPAMSEWDRIEQFESDAIENAGHEWRVWTKGFNQFTRYLFK